MIFTKLFYYKPHCLLKYLKSWTLQIPEVNPLLYFRCACLSRMGAQVSRVYGFMVRRPLQRYNVEHRAEKMVKKFEDPTAVPHRAPMYKSDAEVLEAVRRDNPEVLESVAVKNDPLHDRLKSVYVASSDPAPDPRAGEAADRPLPKDVRQHYQVSFFPLPSFNLTFTKSLLRILSLLK